MNVILFGATGMVGQGALLECLESPAVDRVLAVGRRPTGRPHAKLRELIHRDFTDLAPIEGQLAGYDACFFCLGVSSLGMKEPDYRRVTYDFALAAARTLARLNPGMTFIYVSGSGTDSSEKGRAMWARVKGKTENDILVPPLQSLCLPPGVHTAPQGRDRRHHLAAPHLCRARSALPAPENALPQVRHHHHAGRPRHDRGRPARRPQARPRERRY